MLSRQYYVFIAIALAFASIFFSLFKGSVTFPINQLFNPIFLKLRLPRTISAFIAGGLLALAGSLMQVLLQNPLADPYVLGISSAAAFFTLVLMFFGFMGQTFIGAWVGSLLCIAFMALLARKHGWNTHTLLLCGIALTCGFSAGISFILLITPDTNLHSMLFWLSGDLNATEIPWLGSLILGITLTTCCLLGRNLNLLLRGEKEAFALGLAIQPYRILLFLLSSLCTAAAVTIAGCIGFVGLIVPHISRVIVGHHHSIMLPTSVLLGGALVTLADTFARTLFAPQQLPLGIFLALLGVPAFLWLLQK